MPPPGFGRCRPSCRQVVLNGRALGGAVHREATTACRPCLSEWARFPRPQRTARKPTSAPCVPSQRRGREACDPRHSACSVRLPSWARAPRFRSNPGPHVVGIDHGKGACVSLSLTPRKRRSCPFNSWLRVPWEGIRPVSWRDGPQRRAALISVSDTLCQLPGGFFPSWIRAGLRRASRRVGPGQARGSWARLSCRPEA